MRRKKAEGQNAARFFYMPTSLDLGVAEWHRWLAKFGGSFPWGPGEQLFPAVLGIAFHKHGSPAGDGMWGSRTFPSCHLPSEPFVNLRASVTIVAFLWRPEWRSWG